jgi:hypothetical protein
MKHEFMRFEGFTFQQHPARKGWSIQICIYSGSMHNVLTLSELLDPDVEGAKKELGTEVPSYKITPFMQRAYTKGQLPLADLKDALQRAYPDSTFYWYERQPKES